MNRSLSSNELALFRSRPQAARYYLAVHRPRTVFLAKLVTVPDAYPGSEIRYTDLTSGAASLLSPGMTMYIGRTAGASDLGMLRLRASAASPVLGMAEFGSGLINWTSAACLTVIDQFSVWPVHHSYRAATSRWLVDFDLYTSQLERYGPLALAGPPAVGFMDGGKMVACYVGDFSRSLTPGVSITSQRWEFPNGQLVTSALGTSLNPIQITYLDTSPAGSYVSLTVTDSQGGSHVARRLTFAFGSGADQPLRSGFDTIGGGVRAGGYRTRLTLHESGLNTNVPDNAFIVLFESASYDSSGGSSIGGNFPFRANNVFTGIVERESQRFDAFTGELGLDVRTMDGYLEKTDAYDLFLQNANDGTAASDWDMAGSLTIERAAIALIKYRSTIANVFDVHLNGGELASAAEIEYQSLPRGSLWSQLAQNHRDKGMLGLVAADLQSNLFLTLDAQVTGLSANLPTMMTIAKQDRRDNVVIERDHLDLVSEQVLYAVAGVSPVGGVSPANPIGYFGGRREVTRGLAVDSQQTVITWAGNVRAAENNPFKRVVVPLAGNLRLDSVPQARVQMSLSAADNVRGVSFNNDVFLPYETNIRYDARMGAALTEIVMEKSVNGIGGSAVTFPATGGSDFGSFPIIPLPPLEIPPVVIIPETPGSETQGDGNIVFAIRASKIVRTTNFSDASPVWADITGTVTGTMRVFRLDPWNPANAAVVVSSDGIWYSSNIRAASPTWTQTLSLAQMRTLTGDSALAFDGNTRMMMSPNVNGFVGVLVVGTPVFTGHYIRTTSYTGGSTSWSHMRIGTSSTGTGNATGFWVSQHTTDRVYACFGHHSGFDVGLWYSSNGGASWTQYDTGMTANGAGFCLFIPYNGNSDDQMIFAFGVGTGGSEPDFLFRTTGGPSGAWTQIGADPFPSGGLGNDVEEAMTESPSSSAGTTVYFTDNAGLLYRINGTSFSVIDSSNRGTGNGFGGWPYSSSRLQRFNNATDEVIRSEDGGVTWISAHGNLDSVSDNGAIVRYLVPIWIAT